MTLTEQRNATKSAVKLFAQTEAEPTLADTDAELGLILDQARRATIWTTATAYAVGAVILPTVRNGRRYKCVQAGTSAATEPEWSLAIGAQVGDGTGNLVWREDGPDWENVYDLRQAIYLAWRAKAAKAANLYQINKGGHDNHAMQQIYDHCLAEARRWAPLQVG